MAKATDASKKKAAALSQERIVDSDSEGDSRPTQTVQKSKKDPKTRQNTLAARPKVTKPSTTSQSAAIKPVKDKAQSAPAVKPTAVAQRQTKQAREDSEESESSESEQESDEEESDEDSSADESPATSAIVPGKANGVKRKAAEEISSEEEDSDSDGEETAPQAKRARSKEAEAAIVVESSDSEDEEVEDEEMPDVSVTAQPAKPAVPSAKSTRQAIPARPYHPPAGYSLVESATVSSETSTLLSGSALEGKQIWHIIAPSNVPLSNLKSLSLSAINSTTPVLTHNNISYILRPNHAATSNSSVLVPHNSTYEFASAKVMSTLQLQAQIDLPNLSKRQADLNTGSSAAANIAQAPLSAIRPQPKGLRMRFRPPGFGSGNPGRIGVDNAEGAGKDDDEDMDGGERDGQALQFPQALGAHTGRLRPDTSGTNAPAPAKSKKSKKRREGVESLPTAPEVSKQADDDAAAKAARKEARRKKKQEGKA
ncbi:uncharacterized protein K489DRAFT_377759 [Dissoconium aciculare CBS 342.82]|uniref:Uncharacterized protein n=1 Tax=Dissoconium aciculare CBS 342.82 TaxID=1314786 RepID=A0A6J3MC67_9PEZI|nr:uncharacterized protein K489DRAFT_377759 [Dissoconium aciculare CBS 342.82]KAF1825209.1 hypothetical protein K489DRAFT_377759 [Dissoconium aciculare CBS 342.82]